MEPKKLEDLDLEELLDVKEKVKLINSEIHKRAVERALDYLKRISQYEGYEWDGKKKPSGSPGLDIRGFGKIEGGLMLKVVGQVKTSQLTGTDSAKKENIILDLVKMMDAKYFNADKYFFVVCKEAKKFAEKYLVDNEELCRKSEGAKRITVVNLYGMMDIEGLNKEFLKS